MFPAYSPRKIVEIFDPALLAGIDRLLARTILFESGMVGQSSSQRLARRRSGPSVPNGMN
jgi:hypothetical protein